MNTVYTQRIILFTLALFFVAGVVSFVHAAFNPEINYQGKLTNASDVAVNDGDYNIRFRLYTTASGGSPIWTETLCYSSDGGTTCDGTGTDNRPELTNGLFSVLLGDITSLASVDFNQTLYLGVEIGGSGTTPVWDGEMTPRKKLGAVPAAFEAERLDGIDSTSFLRSDEADAMAVASSSTALTITQSGVGDIFNVFDGGTEVLTVLDGGNVGMGTDTPLARLHINGGTGALSTGLVFGDGDTGFYEASDDNLRIKSNGNDILTIKSTGLVDIDGGNNDRGSLRIASRNPNIAVNVIRSNVTDSGAAFNIFDLKATNDTTTADWIRLGATGSVTQGTTPTLSYFFIGNAYNDTSLRLYANKNATFDGNVGIGTTSPTSKLHINGTLGALSGGLAFGDGDTGFYESSDDVLRLQIAGTDRVTFDASGNYVTGTMSALARMHLEDTSASLLYGKRSGAFNFVQYRRSAGTWTDITAEAAISLGTVSGDVLDASGDTFVIGKTDKFSNIYIDIGTATSSGGTFVWEYSLGGDTWATLTATDGTVSGGIPLAQDGVVSFTPPVDWATDSQNSSAQLYFVRIRVTGGAFTTEPTVYLVVPTDGSPLMQMYANAGDTTPTLLINRNGNVTIGYSPTSASPSIYRLAVTGNVSFAGSISSVSTIATSGANTNTLSATGGLYSGGFITVAPSATALIRANNSPIVRLGSSSWNGSASEVNSMEMLVKPDAFGSAVTSGRFVLKNSTADNVVTDTELLSISSNGDLVALGTTFGSEVLQDSTMDTAPTTNWTVTGDWAYTTGDYTFTYSTGSGTITQPSARFLTPAVANRWYKLTYVVGVVGPAGTEAWVGSEFADKIVRMHVLTTGTYVIYFKSNAAPGDFKIYTTANATSGLRIDSVSLQEVQSGNITASGLFTGGGASGLKITQDGNVGIGDISPDHKLDIAGNIGLDTSSYINFGDVDGITGYGLRDNAGTIEYKNSGGSWSTFGGGLSGGTAGYNAYWTDVGTLGSEQYVATSRGGTGINTSASNGIPTISSGTWNIASSLGVTQGGTGTTTQFNQGSIIFAGASGIYGQDNANFFWDDTNNWLGLGTVGPDRKLDILDTSNPQMRLTYTDGSVYSDFQTNSGGDLIITPSGGDISIVGNLLPSANDTYGLGSDSYRWKDLYLGGDTLHLGTSLTDEGTIGYDTTNNILNFGTDSTTNADVAFFGDDLYLDKSSGYVGIGTTSPAAPFHLGAASALFGVGEGGTPADFTFRGAAASGSNIAGGDIYFNASNGTGGGGSGDFIFQTASPSGTDPIAFDATSTSHSAGTSSLSWSHTVGANSSRLLVVGVSVGSTASVSSVTYGGVSLTRLTYKDNGVENRTELWYLKNPSSGAANIVVTMSSSAMLTTGATSWYNVNQDTTFGTPATASGSTSTPTVDVSSSANEVVVDVVAGHVDMGSASLSVGSGQTQQWNYNQTESMMNGEAGAGSSEAGASSVTMSWSLSGGVTRNWSISAVSIKPVANSSQNTLAERLRINSVGNVGIGDATPSHLLDVAGNIGLSASSYINWGDIDGTSGYGFRDSSGTIQYKNSSGTWSDLGSLTMGATIGSATQGSILFAGSAGVLTQDNANFFWDDTNNWLGIGTAAPSAPLHLAGASALFGIGEGGTPADFTFRGAAGVGTSIAGGDITFDASNGTGAGGSGDFIFRTAGAASLETITHDNTTSASSAGNTSSLTFSHTTGTGTSRVLVVGVSVDGNVAVSSITYAGQNLTKVSSARHFSTNANAELWYLVNPASGANNVVVTMANGTESFTAGAMTFSGVSQSDPIGTYASATGQSTAPSVDVSAATGQVVVDILSTDSTDTATVGSGQTSRWSRLDSLSTSRGSGSTEAGASSVTMSWTMSGSTEWAIIAVPLQQAGVTTDPNVLAERLRITSGGDIGIGTATPSELLTVYNGSTTGTYTTSGWAHSSDVRLKTNITALGGALDTVSALQGVTFNWKTDPDGKREIGFIAQDVMGVLPEVVTGNEEDGYGIAYGNLSALLVNAVKEVDVNMKSIDVSYRERISHIESSLGYYEHQDVLAEEISGGDVWVPFWTFDADMGKIISIGLVDMNGNGIHDVAEIVGIDETWSVNRLGLLTVNGLVVRGDIEVGSREKPSGITLYDEVTGEPYCLRMVGGVMESTFGTCESLRVSSVDASVGDITPPTITIRGNNPARIEIGDEYGDLGATISDDIDEHPTLEIYVEGEKVDSVRITATEDAVYEIKYTAYDDAGNTTIATRTVIVGNGGVDIETGDGTTQYTPSVEIPSAIEADPEPSAEEVPTEPEPTLKVDNENENVSTGEAQTLNE